MLPDQENPLIIHILDLRDVCHVILYRKNEYNKIFYLPGRFWMDNLYCSGNEDELTLCRFDGWGHNDCDPTEAAGVVCDEGDLEEVQEKKEHVERKVIL